MCEVFELTTLYRNLEANFIRVSKSNTSSSLVNLKFIVLIYRFEYVISINVDNQIFYSKWFILKVIKTTEIQILKE